MINSLPLFSSKTVLLVLSLIFIHPCIRAQYVWDGGGGDNNWSTLANWDVSGSDPGSLPTITDTVNLDVNTFTVGTPLIIDVAATAASAIFADDQANYYVTIQNNIQTSGNLQWSDHGNPIITHNSGTVTVGGNYQVANRGGDTTYTMNGGALDITGTLFLGRGDTGQSLEFIQNTGSSVTVDGGLDGATAENTGASVTYTMNGGTLTAGDTRIAFKAQTMYFNQSGGNADFTGNLTLAASDSNDPGYGVVTISDAADTSITGNLKVGSDDTTDGGAGRLILDGSRTGGSNLLTDTADFQYNSTFEVIIDDAAIASAGDMRFLDVAGQLDFDANSQLLARFDPSSTPTAGTWKIAEFDSIVDNGLSLDPSTDSGWALSFNSNELYVTYTIPEISTLAMLGLSMVGLLAFRRKR